MKLYQLGTTICSSKIKNIESEQLLINITVESYNDLTDKLTFSKEWEIKNKPEIGGYLLCNDKCEFYFISAFAFENTFNEIPNRPKKKKKRKTFVLIKPIIIPAGTRFEDESGTIRNMGQDTYEALIGLSKNTCGNFSYMLDEKELEEVKDYFVELL
jgi:hypothetical protein